MSKKLSRTEAVKLIYQALNDVFMIGGLPRAISIYNYLTGGGIIEIYPETINRYFMI